MDAIMPYNQPPHLNKMDDEQRHRFVQFYRSLDEKPSSTVRFFNHFTAYTVLGKDDIHLISRMVYQSCAQLSEKQPNVFESIPYLTIPKHKFKPVIRQLLLNSNYRVEVYSPRFLYSGWNIEYYGSPSNLLQFEDVLFTTTSSKKLENYKTLSLQICMRNNQRRLGVTIVDQNDCMFHIMEFEDDENYTELKAVFVILAPMECLLPSTEGEYGCVKNLLEQHGIMATVFPKFLIPNDIEDFLHDLNQLLRGSKNQKRITINHFAWRLPMTMEALKMAMEYLRLATDTGSLEQYLMKELDLKGYLRLDFDAAKNLNIFPKSHLSSTSSCILDILDHCVTAQGHRLMSQWVRQPLNCGETLNYRHDIVECFLNSPKILHLLHEGHLKRIPDILLLTKKLRRLKADMQDIYCLYKVIMRLPKIITLLGSLENLAVTKVLCEPLQNCLEQLLFPQLCLEPILDLEAFERGKFLVNLSPDRVLLNLSRRLSYLLEKMQKSQEQTLQELNLENITALKLVNVAYLGYTLIISEKYERVLYQNENYKVLDIYRGKIFFTTPMLSLLNEEFSTLSKQYEQEYNKIVNETIILAAFYTPSLINLNHAIAELDCLLSYAKVAEAEPKKYIRPLILKEGSGQCILEDIEPLWQEMQHHITFIAYNVDFQWDIKSTHMQAVYTIVLMALVGSFVPCKEATISMFNSIANRPRADDHLKVLSTFTEELKVTSGLKNSDGDKPLVIINEAGAKTPYIYGGCETPWSIAENLAKEGKYFAIFAINSN
ncbi:DNA mismatch repair protein spellchecker 1 [Stomoxys calcitrans]|uniref:DNA mismatch repair protein spellchecker 1 n=1 Tax=Stomoxys calcitrans TaxID=35570 RepID=UPI0027E356FB|nr:DNA mismatch repair protein spellchecker 1 [Stomoxys calcitrans]